MSDTTTTETVEQAEPKPRRRRKSDTSNGNEARQYPDQRNLRQIETKRQRREPLGREDTTAFAAREARGWAPQAEASAPFWSWHEDHYVETS